MNYDFSNFWFFLAIILMVLEVVLGMTIVLFFASLAAVIIGLMMIFGFISQAALTMQIALFLAATILLSASLLKPLRALLSNYGTKSHEYNNMIGQQVTALEDIFPGQIGNVEWSGTIFKAQMAPDCLSEKIIAKKHATIVAVKNNVLIINNIY